MIDAKTVEKLDAELTYELEDEEHLGRVRRYLRGEHDMPYMPRGAKREYRHLAKRSITNWLPLVPDTFNKQLYVDGFRSMNGTEDSRAWDYWQANGLDARQSIVHRGALEYGTSYLLVLPGDTAPVMAPLSPLRTAAWYADDDDEFPEVAIRRKGVTIDGDRIIEAFDAKARYTYVMPEEDGSRWRLTAVDKHGLGVTPIIRFRDRLDAEAVGLVEPLITLQDRVNETVFSMLIALQYASFRQRWATGLSIPEDEEGAPIEPFEAAVDRLWVADNTEARFGDFAQTEVQGHLSIYQSSVRSLAAVAQISPNILTGDLVNLSADALSRLDAQTQAKTREYQNIFGEAWESGFRLAARAAGDPDIDPTAQVRWRDTEPRALSTTVDALGKLSQMLGVPAEALWERVPGVTDQDIAYWKATREAMPTPPTPSPNEGEPETEPAPAEPELTVTEEVPNE